MLRYLVALLMLSISATALAGQNFSVVDTAGKQHQLSDYKV